jgi:hypothetical protein
MSITPLVIEVDTGDVPHIRYEDHDYPVAASLREWLTKLGGYVGQQRGPDGTSYEISLEPWRGRDLDSTWLMVQYDEVPTSSENALAVTLQARLLLGAAQEEARRRDLSLFRGAGTELLLLALLSDTHGAGDVFRRVLGYSRSQEIVSSAAQLQDEDVQPDQVPVISDARDHASRLGHKFIATEHFLLSLLLRRSCAQLLVDRIVGREQLQELISSAEVPPAFPGYEAYPRPWALRYLFDPRGLHRLDEMGTRMGYFIDNAGNPVRSVSGKLVVSKVVAEITLEVSTDEEPVLDQISGNNAYDESGGQLR